jgi:hypothetical protein
LDDCDPVALCVNETPGFSCSCPGGYSGDGVAVAEGGSGCVARLFVADGKATTAGNLYLVDPTDATTTVVGAIGVAITGLAFAGDGTLYGTEAAGEAAIMPQFVSIDPATGAATNVGTLVDGNNTEHDAVADITWDSINQQLIGWSEVGDQPIVIDTTDGGVTILGGGTASYGGAMASNAAGVVYIAPEGNTGVLYTVDTGTGVVTAGPTLNGGNAQNDALNSMTFFNGVLYAVESDDAADPTSAANLVTIDTTTGVITLVGALPPGIDAIASAAP